MTKGSKKNAVIESSESSDDHDSNNDSSDSDNEIDTSTITVTAKITNKSENKDNDNDEESNRRKIYRGFPLNKLITEQNKITEDKKNKWAEDKKLLDSDKKTINEKSIQLEKDLQTIFKEQKKLDDLYKRGEKLRMEFEVKRKAKSDSAKLNPSGIQKEKEWAKDICEFVNIDKSEKISFVNMQKLCMAKFKLEFGMTGKFINTSKDHKYFKLFNIKKGDEVTQQIFSQKLSDKSKI